MYCEFFNKSRCECMIKIVEEGGKNFRFSIVRFLQYMGSTIMLDEGGLWQIKMDLVNLTASTKSN